MRPIIESYSTPCSRAVHARRPFAVEQSLHHGLHLAFVGATEPDHGLFDSQCSVFMNDKSLGDRCADRRATRLAK
jgi:hypothetical protein